MIIHDQERAHDKCSPLFSEIISHGTRRNHIPEEIVEQVIYDIKSYNKKSQAAQKLPDPIDAIKEVMQQRGGLTNKNLKTNIRKQRQCL